ncbi:hypothetical protein PAL_GLEAN10018138 [Pteropus alecto]|uniref:Uncharacterized protein n=1 Tax=Pteropus alecto TaxID=9402 RepID=L5KY34_PTEAL|nr:hypothetical protein PAL_GLEAN10018138 [Pteropus alecto]
MPASPVAPLTSLGLPITDSTETAERPRGSKTPRHSLRGHQASLGSTILSPALVPWANPSAELAAQQLLLPTEAQL